VSHISQIVDAYSTDAARLDQLVMRESGPLELHRYIGAALLETRDEPDPVIADERGRGNLEYRPLLRLPLSPSADQRHRCVLQR